MTRGSLPFAVLAALYLGVVGILTLGPTPWRTRPRLTDYDVLSLTTWLDPATWSRGLTAEFVANIALFVPLGLLLRFALPRATWVGAALLGAGFSVAVEVLQVFGPRISDPRDVVANSIGALAGALIAALAAAVTRPVRRALSRRGVRDQPVPDRRGAA
jgi:glycopeptide antibiotics resistance protein